jgi:hypothetical protein
MQSQSIGVKQNDVKRVDEGSGPVRVGLSGKHIESRKSSGRAKILLDLKETVVLLDAFGSRQRARLDLADVQSYDKVRDERI